MTASGKRVCVLTGAGGRLGSAFCSAYSDTYDIVAVYRNKPPPVPSQDQRFIDPLHPSLELSENRHEVFAVRADLSRTGEAERITELALARFGRVDLLVNAAADSVWAPFTDPVLLDSAERQFVINTVAPLRLSAALCRMFWRHRPDENAELNRNIVNISSCAGYYVYPDTGQSLYAATKAALNQLTYHMAAELWSAGVRVNAAAPNSFPAIIATERVTRAIVEFDRGQLTGKIQVLDADAEYYL
jgi:NAD(P)-dependent dehydrogenase (short-subunit alcohol dehydrogenase family)